MCNPFDRGQLNSRYRVTHILSSSLHKVHTDVEDFKSWSWWIHKGLIFLVDQSPKSINTFTSQSKRLALLAEFKASLASKCMKIQSFRHQKEKISLLISWVRVWWLLDVIPGTWLRGDQSIAKVYGIGVVPTLCNPLYVFLSHMPTSIFQNSFGMSFLPGVQHMFDSSATTNVLMMGKQTGEEGIVYQAVEYYKPLGSRGGTGIWHRAYESHSELHLKAYKYHRLRHMLFHVHINSRVSTSETLWNETMRHVPFQGIRMGCGIRKSIDWIGRKNSYSRSLNVELSLVRRQLFQLSLSLKAVTLLKSSHLQVAELDDFLRGWPSMISGTVTPAQQHHL